MSLGKQESDTANEQAKMLLETAKKRNGMIPNMYAYMVNSPGLLSTYMHGYDLFRKESGFTPAEQEVVFLTISVENGCEYCVAAHSVVADMQSKVPSEVTEAIRMGGEIPNPKLRALSEFTSVMLNKRGRPDPEDVSRFLDAGYAEKQILEIIFALAVKTISNYSNHIFDTPIDPVFKARKWDASTIAQRQFATSGETVGD